VDLDRLCVERRAVVELDVLAEVERVGGGVTRDFPARRQARNEGITIGVFVDEGVVDEIPERGGTAPIADLRVQVVDVSGRPAAVFEHAAARWRRRRRRRGGRGGCAWNGCAAGCGRAGGARRGRLRWTGSGDRGGGKSA